MQHVDVVAILGVILSLGMPIIIVIAVLVYRFRRQRLVNDVILKLAEKGAPVPPELFLEPVRPRSDLRRGLVLMAAGAGIAMFGVFDGDSDVIGIGFIPLLIGVGYLIAYKLEHKDVPPPSDSGDLPPGGPR